MTSTRRIAIRPMPGQGMSLIELMLVIVVLGILVSIAYPNYREFAARAQRNEAKAMLLQIAANQERWYLNNNSFTTDMTNLGFDVAGNFVTETGSYQINVTSADANNFTATATYLKSDDEAGRCGSFLIDGRGEKTSAPYDDCWTRTN